MAGETAWTEQRRRKGRAEYQRLYAGTGTHKASHVVTIPDDITVLDRDPSPCGWCGVRGDVACKHKPWLLAGQGNG